MSRRRLPTLVLVRMDPPIWNFAILRPVQAARRERIRRRVQRVKRRAERRGWSS